MIEMMTGADDDERAPLRQKLLQYYPIWLSLSPERLSLKTVPSPAPGDGEVT